MRPPLLFSLLLLLFLACLCSTSRGDAAALLKEHFYKHTCPQAEHIVQSVVYANVAANPALPAKFLRLFFHDCFVRGCDASVLMDSTKGKKAEKDAIPNKSLGGFDVIDRIKTAVEKECPGTVSCADIVALAARDSVSYQFSKKLWEVQLGRRDGTVSSSSEAKANLPSPSSNFTTLASEFAKKGLDIKDLVILSGGHTIGVGHCNQFSKRLYNFTGRKGGSDQSLNLAYAAFLRTKCRTLSDNTTTVAMDPGSSTRFDTHYYMSLKLGQGLFQSDAALLTDRRSAAMIHRLLDQGEFFEDFKNSIRKMGRVGVLTGSDGEIRKNCRVANSHCNL